MTVRARRTRSKKQLALFTLLLSVASVLWLVMASGQNDALLKKKANERFSKFAEGSPWISKAACEEALRLRKIKAKQRRTQDRYVKIASWNLHWFPDAASDTRGREEGTDIDWLACVVAWIDLRVLSVQEVKQNLRGRRAIQDLLDRLDEYTSGKWQARFDDCPDDGRQHVGLLFDEKSVTVEALRTVASLNPTGSRCGGRLRPGYAAYLRFRGGVDLHLLNLHLDSGVSSRDYRNRVTSWQRLIAFVQDQNRVVNDDDILVMGDFNTMGCTKCPERISAEDEIGRLEQLLSRVPVLMRRLKPNPNCTAHFRGRGSTLDHIFVASQTKEAPIDGIVHVDGLCAETSCFQNKRFPKTALVRLSDHCPIVVKLLDQDLD